MLRYSIILGFKVKQSNTDRGVTQCI